MDGAVLKVERPWGFFEVLTDGDRYRVKRLTIQPGEALSLQLHNYRAEHWVVVKGIAEVTCGDKVFFLAINESTYIPAGTKHRLRNTGVVVLEIIEVQTGSRICEEDIVRFDDNYNRC